jgi:hypothetical protein
MIRITKHLFVSRGIFIIKENKDMIKDLFESLIGSELSDVDFEHINMIYANSPSLTKDDIATMYKTLPKDVFYNLYSSYYLNGSKGASNFPFTSLKFENDSVKTELSQYKATFSDIQDTLNECFNELESGSVSSVELSLILSSYLLRINKLVNG